MPNKESEAGKQKVKVAFQGERGAYSESAVFQFFGADTQVKPCKDFKDVFESVDTEETQYGVVPVENSLEGSINQNYDLFLKYDLKVCGEVIVKIEHCLIANPGTALKKSKPSILILKPWRNAETFLEEFGRELIPDLRHGRQRQNAQRKSLKERRGNSQRKSSRTSTECKSSPKTSRTTPKTTPASSSYPKKTHPQRAKTKPP